MESPVRLFAKLPTPFIALPFCDNTPPCAGSVGCESSMEEFNISELLLYTFFPIYIFFTQISILFAITSKSLFKSKILAEIAAAIEL